MKRNPRGKKGKFAKCVSAVSKRGGAYDPRAVCAAQERRLGYMNPEQKRGYVIGGSNWIPDLSHAKRQAQYDADRTGRPVQVTEYASGKLRATKYPKKNPRRRNPEQQTLEAYQDFHGRQPDEFVTIKKRIHVHGWLPGAGELRRMVVISRNKKFKVTMTRFEGALLAFNEKRNQLFIEGGDQAVNLQDFGITREPHEVETLGRVVSLDYFTTKDHLGSEGGSAIYRHKFRTTNELGQHVTVRIAEYPDLIYHVLDERLEFSGGSYTILREGIDL